MRVGIFDSKAERKVFKRLDALWSRYVEVYPQVPVRKVLRYERLQELNISRKSIDYLLNTEFDYVVCDKNTCPLLVVEFDGIGHGFSRDGQYVPIAVPISDPHRKLKLDAKLDACARCGVSAVIVSFPEVEPADDPDCPITVLDAVIGEVVEGQARQDLLSEFVNSMPEFEDDTSAKEGISVAIDEIEVMAESKNPIRCKIRELWRKLPVGQDLQVHPLHDRPGYVGARRTISGGFRTDTRGSSEQILVTASAYVRQVNCGGDWSFWVADLIAEYRLVRKAIREVGMDPQAWSDLRRTTPWTHE